jgi:hypothetical protein
MKNKPFYYDWLFPKMFAYSRYKGWAIPELSPLITSILPDILQRAESNSSSPEARDLIECFRASGNDSGTSLQSKNDTPIITLSAMLDDEEKSAAVILATENDFSLSTGEVDEQIIIENAVLNNTL